MRISTKLIASFMPVILLMVALALYLTNISQKSLRQSVGESSMFLAEEMLKRITRSIYFKIELLQSHSHNILFEELLLESNREFKKFDDVEGYVTQKDREWGSAPKDQINPFMQDIINNKLSNNLRQEIVEFYEKKYGYKFFQEIFITNRYGANVAQTIKTSDYKQDDEDWWQITKERKVYVSDVEYDDSSQSHGITIGVRIDDNTGDFIGVLKAVLSVKEIIREAEIAVKKYETTNTLLIRKDGLLLYRTSAFRFLEDLSNKDLFKMIQNERGFFTAVDGGIEKLFSYAHAKGYREFGSLGWILLVGHDVEEILKPTSRLRNTMFSASIILITMGIIIAFFMSRSIIRPIAILSKGVEIIGKGELGHRVEVKAKDEIGDLAGAFNEMLEKRREVEAALRENEERYRALFEQAVDSIVLIDGETGDLLEFNESAHKNLEYTRAEFQKLRISDFEVVESAKEVTKHIEKIVKEGTDPFETKHRTKTGKIRDIHVNSKSISIRGKKLIQSIWRDITERKQAEEELKKHRENLEDMVEKRTAKLEEVNAELESFAYSISHDLRAPLRAMQGFSQALLEDCADKLDARGKEYARRIDASAQRMETLIQDLLNYSRLSRSEIELKPVNLDSVVENILKQLDTEIQKKDAQITVDRPLPETAGHKATLEQIVENLITNAVKFVPSKTQPNIHIWAEESDETVRLWVEDNGIGIDQEHHDRIFRIFERLHGIERYPGTGVGLAIVKRGIEKLGGRVGVESAPEKGSKFWIELGSVHS